MKAYKVILLLILIVSCWNCTEPELGMEKEMLLNTKSNLRSGDVTVGDLFVEPSPEKFKLATGKILNNGFGKRLLQRVKNICPKGPFIHFYPLLDKDGNLDKSKDVEFRYWGNGKIDYNYKALNDENNDELLFHEFFHIFQTENRFPVRSRNNEVEAYVAQYLYITSDDKAPSIIDRIFTKMIAVLAICIDRGSGNFVNETDLDLFYKNYKAALDYLEILPAYNDDGWFSNPIDRNTHPFPNLVKLMKS